MPNYCILRTAKLKTMGNVAGSAAHTFREIPTDNADPLRTPLNVHNGPNNKNDLVSALKKRLEPIPTIRKNAVLALEYFFGASPEFFKDSSKEEQDKFFENTRNWLIEKHGKDNVLYFGIQYDETTPHAVAYIVPVDKKGKLNASAFVDGKKMLSEMQSDFAEKVGQTVGLDRGLEWSKANHVSIGQFYGAINTEIPEPKTIIPPVPVPTKSDVIKAGMGIETDYQKAAKLAEEARLKRANEEEDRRKIVEAKAAAFEAERRKRDKKAEALEELRQAQRQQANEVRGIPLETVLKRLGCEPDPDDKKNWKTPAGRITVTGSKFFNHDADKGGGGAIDLVMHIEGFGYTDAISWLGGAVGKDSVMIAVQKKAAEDAEKVLAVPAKALEPPKPDPTKWPRVKAYLTDVRHIKESIIDSLHDAKRLYADRFANAVFLSADGKSAQIRGTGEKPFHGIRGPNKDWILAAKPDQQTTKIICVESAIDALSYAEIHGFKEGETLVSMGGSAGDALRKLAQKAKKLGAKIVAAFDRDKEGDRMADLLKNEADIFERATPMKKDWNEDLKEIKSKKIQENNPDIKTVKKIEPK